MELHEEVARVARELYEKSGRVHGRDLENWLEAERIVKARHGGRGDGNGKEGAEAEEAKPKKAAAMKASAKKTEPKKPAAKKTKAKKTE
ncbi:MAG TPA: DUF2934 domain-containing protein [Dissulfurispiraceae bacterium]